jgi:ribosomal protein S18 acetylase RimI-like enzyme
MTEIQAYLRAIIVGDHQVLATGPFDIFVNPSSDHPYSNYAIPRPGAEPDADAVQELITLMEGAGRVPRLEYLPAQAPAVEQPLLDAGFAVELRTPVMCCTPDDLAEVEIPDHVTIDQLGPDATREELEGLLRAQTEAFGDPFDPADIARLVPMLGRRVAVLAYADGEVAGGGMCQVPIAGVTELVGIAVREDFRRRGVATAITAELTRHAFAAGVETAFMTPGDTGAQAAYERAGYAATDEMLHLIRR